MSTWEHHAAAILECWLCGQAAGGAAADLLTGAANPSGKLAETMPRAAGGQFVATSTSRADPGWSATARASSSATGRTTSADRKSATRSASGSRTRRSSIADLEVEVRGSVADGDLSVRVRLHGHQHRCGGRRRGGPGLRQRSSSRAPTGPSGAEGLRQGVPGAGRESAVDVELDERAFAFWSIEHRRWVVEAGEFEIAVGSSSRDLPLREVISLEAPSSGAPAGWGLDTARVVGRRARPRAADQQRHASPAAGPGADQGDRHHADAHPGRVQHGPEPRHLEGLARPRLSRPSAALAHGRSSNRSPGSVPGVSSAAPRCPRGLRRAPAAGRPPVPRWRRRTASCRAPSSVRGRRAARRGCPARRSGRRSITRITSASRMVESRCAMTKLVRSERSAAIARWTSTSVRVSTELVGLVQDQQRRVGQEGAGDGDQLLLAGADVAALVVDDRVVAVRQGVHEPVDVGGLGGGLDLVLAGLRPAVRDVLAGWCRGTARCPAAPCRSGPAAAAAAPWRCRRRRG